MTVAPFRKPWSISAAGRSPATRSAVPRRRRAGNAADPTGPFPGRVFRPFLFRSPAELPSHCRFIRHGVEGEFAFELAADIPARPDPWTREEIAHRVACLFPAIEIIDTRFTRFAEAGILRLTADTGANGGLVLGKPFPTGRRSISKMPESSCPSRAVESGRGRGRDALGPPAGGADLAGQRPLAARLWLAGRTGRDDRHLHRHAICPGSGGTATADFGSAGRGQRYGFAA